MKSLSLSMRILLALLFLLSVAIAVRYGVTIYVQHYIERNIDDFQR